MNQKKSKLVRKFAELTNRNYNQLKDGVKKMNVNVRSAAYSEMRSVING